jgi:hypothetical protein
MADMPEALPECHLLIHAQRVINEKLHLRIQRLEAEVERLQKLDTAKEARVVAEFSKNWNWDD